MTNNSPEVIFPEHFGFCAGVAAADQLMRDVALEAGPYDIDVVGFHQIVHNEDVVSEHTARGVTFVDEVDEIPENSAVVISAHGASPKVFSGIKAKGCEVFDATCPLVTDTHDETKLARENGEKVIYICHGKPGGSDELHDEVAGMVGHLDYAVDEQGNIIEAPIERVYLEVGEDLDLAKGLLDEEGKYRIISQTTLHADRCLAYREAIKTYILKTQPKAEINWSRNRGNVCRAVADRQNGVMQLLQIRPKRVVVATSAKSKNGMGYVSLAEKEVKKAQMDTTVHAVASAEEARQLGKIAGITGMTASASTPRPTIEAIARALGAEQVPEVIDRVFKLGDSKPGVIARKIADHARRLQ